MSNVEPSTSVVVRVRTCGALVIADSIPAEGTKPAPADPEDPLGHLYASN
jgi:hypothetical protein